MRRFLPLLALVALASPTGAQEADPAPPAFRQALDPDTVTVGERFRTALIATLPPGTTLEVTVPVDTTADAWAIGSARVHPPAAAGGEHRVVVTMVAWRPGTLPPDTALVEIRAPDGFVSSVRVPLRMPFVRSVLPADSSLHIPRPAKDVIGPNGPPAWVWMAGVALLLALAALAAWLWRRSRRHSPAPRGVPTDARARALAELRDAEASGLVEQGSWAAFYARVGGALRRFLAETEPAWGPDLSTRELVGALQRDGVEEDRIAVLAQMLERADLAKFARHDFTVDDARGDVVAARAWVEGFPARASADSPSDQPSDDRGGA